MHPHRRIRHAVIGLLVYFFSFAPARGEPSDAQLACELREALGFGARTLAALGVSETPYATAVADAESFVDSNRQTVAPLLAAIDAAKKELVRAQETDGDLQTCEQAYAEVVDDLEAVCAAVIATMDGRLTTEQRNQRARVADNLLLDPPLSLLDLSSQQRVDLLAAQRARDQVLRHHKDRKDLATIAEALSAFSQGVSTILTGAQQTELATLEANLRAGWSVLADQDEAATAL